MISNQIKNQYIILLYLLSNISEDINSQIRIILRSFLNIKLNQENEIISQLRKENFINKVGSRYFLEDKAKENAKNSLLEILNQEFNIGIFYDKLPNDYRKTFLKNLLDIEHKKIDNFYITLVDKLSSFKNNDNIHINLELLGEYIYRVPDEAIKPITMIIGNKHPLKTKIRKIKGFGNVEGKSHDDLVLKCLELLEKIRYMKPKEAFNLLIDLSIHKNIAIQLKAKEGLGKMAQYNYFVIQKIGYKPQAFLLDEIEKWNDKKLILCFDSLIEISKHTLNPSFEGHSMKDYKTFEYKSGPLSVNENLKKIRERTILLLQKLYMISGDLKQQLKVIQTLQEATQTPHTNYGDDMEKIVLDDTNKLVNYYISIISKANNETVKDIEKQAYWFIRAFTKEKLPKIEQLQSMISKNDNYGMFKVFVGYDHGFAEDSDWQKAQKERKDKIQEFIADISEENFSEWENKILSVVKNYSILDNKGEFQYFNIFLFELAQQKPEIALRLLAEKEKELEDFLIHLIAGVWKSGNKKKVKDLIVKWVDENKHLSICAFVFSYTEEIDKPLLIKIFNKAKAKKDKEALNNIVRSITGNYPKHKDTKDIFIDVIKEMTVNKDWWWSTSVWYRKGSVLEDLNKKDFIIILENLLFAPNIDYQIEEILKPVAEKYSLLVVDFFHDRVSLQSKKKRDEHYDAIPYNLYDVSKILNKNASIVIPAIRKWFNEQDWLFHWEAGHLLQKIFPNFIEMKEDLIELINSGKKKNAEIVLGILRAYKGDNSLHDVCKEFIKKYPKNEKYRAEMFIILSQMGGVSGEYGFVEGYKKKKEAIQSWKKDNDESIQSFVKLYEDSLDTRIAFEQKRADEDIELRKRE